MGFDSWLGKIGMPWMQPKKKQRNRKEKGLLKNTGDPRSAVKIWCSLFQDMSKDGDTPPAAAAVADGAHLLGFSDEILLHILSHIPSTDLVLNVRRTCRKLAALCLDKSLTHTVLLQKDYEVRLCVAGTWRGAGWGPAWCLMAQPGPGGCLKG